MNAVSTIAFAPLIPWPFLAGLAAVAVAAWVLALARRARGAWLRLVPMAVLALALANPRLVAEERHKLAPVAVVVADETLSQQLGDRRAATEQAVKALTERMAKLEGLEVRVEHVASVPGRDDGTRLFAAVDRAVSDLPRARLAGVVLVTDGRVHDLPGDLGRALDAPVHGLITGRPGERDRRVVLGENPGFGLVGKTAQLAFRIEDKGGSGTARVSVRVDGQPYGELSVPVNRDATVEVPIRHGGANVVEIEAEPGPGELTLDNNRAAIGISGVRDRLKVLLISGEPHVGERAWRNLLKADPAVDLVHFTILRPPEKDDRTPIRELSLITFPVRELFEEKLADFDLIIFDRYRRRGVLTSGYYANLAAYVRQGGALLAAVGPEFAEPGGLYDSALADVLPAAPTGRILTGPFRPTVTEAGKRHPVTGALPDQDRWGPWLRQMEVGAAHGTTILSGAQDQPLVILDKVGEGRVAEVLSDSLWLWARGWEGGGPHAELTRRLAHWLMKEPELEEESLSAEIKGDRLAYTRRSLQPQPATVAVTLPDGTKQDLPLEDQGDGRAVAEVPVHQPGLYRVEDGSRTAIAAAGTLAPVELAELTATTEVLKPVADATKGSVRFLSEAGLPDVRMVAPGAATAGRGWLGLVDKDEHTVTGVREFPLLPGLALLVLALGGLILAWRREGR